MGEAEPGRVERLTGEVQEPLADRLGQRAGRSRHTTEVERISDHRVALAGECTRI